MLHSDSFFPGLLPWAILGASLLGSTHCAGMCGGLALSASGRRFGPLPYHFGRLVGYMTLGALAGLLGERFLGSSANVWANWFSALFVGLGLVWIGVRAFRSPTGAPHIPFVPQSWLGRALKLARDNRFLTGVLTALLPCGWLHGFVLSALATRSVSGGSLVLFFFWLGTLPALSLTPLALRRFTRSGSRLSPRLAAVILMATGALSLGLKIAYLPPLSPTQDPPPSCHDMKTDGTHASGHGTNLPE